MNGAHLHLILSHLPVLGVGFGTGLLAVGFLRRNRMLQQSGLVVLVLAGLAAVGTYLTGEAAEETLERRLTDGGPFIERHEELAVVGLVMAVTAALTAAGTLAIGRKRAALSRTLVALNLAMAVTTSLMFVWVANLGGQIGHPEARNSAVPVEAVESEQDER
jgi:uncharacterized membrane protein